MSEDFTGRAYFKADHWLFLATIDPLEYLNTRANDGTFDIHQFAAELLEKKAVYGQTIIPHLTETRFTTLQAAIRVEAHPSKVGARVGGAAAEYFMDNEDAYLERLQERFPHGLDFQGTSLRDFLQQKHITSYQNGDELERRIIREHLCLFSVDTPYFFQARQLGNALPSRDGELISKLAKSVDYAFQRKVLKRTHL